jgi:hypothetical protein
MTERLIGRRELHQRLAPHKTLASFNNELTSLYERGFPRPRKIGARSVRWVESEVDAFILALKRADAGGSPNKKRLSAAQLLEALLARNPNLALVRPDRHRTKAR